MPLATNKPTTKKSRQYGRLLLLLLIVALGAGLYANSQYILDAIKLRGYTPPQAVVQLADQTTLTDKARHLFYLNKPGILPTVQSFRDYCPENQDTIVLGCYHSNETGIYVYNVPDPTLAGVQQVTTAHETLHAAYERLSSAQRASVDSMLQDFYDHGLHDQQVKDEINIYKKTEPDALLNEMHSIFGTEVANLPAGLEQYYKQYFSDRSVILTYRNQYVDQFTQRRNTIVADDAQLASLKTDIDAQQAALDQKLTQLSADRDTLDGYASSNQVAQYNAAVPGFNVEVNAYNSAVKTLKAAISQYNQLVASRNQIAGQLTTLNKALDTRTVQTMNKQ